jgi:hypothetical protein
MGGDLVKITSAQENSCVALLAHTLYLENGKIPDKAKT